MSNIANKPSHKDSLPDAVLRILNAKEGDFHSHIDCEEAIFLHDVIRRMGPINKGVEIGCAFGVSGACICAAAVVNNPDYQHTVIDPFQVSDYKGQGLETIKGASGVHAKLLEDGSEYALPVLTQSEPESFDVVFVDGLHTFENTLLDIYYGMRLLRVGGHLIVDDCRMPPVARAVKCAQTWPFVATAGASPNNSMALTRRLSNCLAALLPEGLAKWLPLAVYNRLFPRARMSTMTVLQKTGADERHWNWYKDF